MSVKLSEQALLVAKSRYFAPHENTWEELSKRVADAVAKVEKEEEVTRYSKEFYDIISNQLFIPAGRVLRNAGFERGLLNCFSLNVQDNIESIAKVIGNSMIVAKFGGGVGIPFSELRPRGDELKKNGGHASGPVSFMKVINTANGIIETGGQRRCFSEDTKILTTDGLLAIKNIVNSNKEYIACTSIGNKKIINKFNNSEQEVIEITVDKGYSVKVTRTHKMCVLNNLGEIEFKEAYKFKIGDRLLLLLGNMQEIKNYIIISKFNYIKPLHSTTLKSIKLPTVLNEDLAYFVGLLFSDGCFIKDKKISISLGDGEIETQKKIIKLGKKLFNIEAIIKQGDGKCKNINFYSRILVEWCKEQEFYFNNCGNLILPKQFYISPSTVIASFIAGVFDGDGCNQNKYNNKSGYSFKLIAKDFIKDLQLLLLSNGIPSYIRGIDRSKNGWRTIYSLSITSKVFKNRFFNFIKNYSTKIQEYNSTSDHSWKFKADIREIGIKDKWFRGVWADNCDGVSYKALYEIYKKIEDIRIKNIVGNILNTVECEIISIEDIGKCDTYDIEVEDTHTLSGNGFYTSNSAALALLDISHPDIEEYLSAKIDNNELSNFNISVGINNKFLRAVKNDEEWPLVFRGKEYRKVNAKKLWDKIVKAAIKSAEPGLLNIDYIKKYSNSEYFAPFNCTNPCISGKTLVETKEGIQKFGDATNIWNGESYSPIVKWSKGVKKVIKLITNHNYTFIVTPEHKFQLNSGIWEEAKNLLNKDLFCDGNYSNIKIIKIEDAGEDEVFDFNEPTYHYMVVGGVRIKNCGEVPLAANESCCLGSLVLPNFITEKTIKWKELDRVVTLSVRFLDDVLTATTYPLKEIEEAAQRGRRIGLGVLGLADFFINLKVRYGSEEALKLSEKLFRFIRDSAYKASIELAKEKGTFSAYSDKYLDNNFILDLPIKIERDIAKFGLRNVALLSCPPNGSTALLTGYSSGIEPIFSKAYWREDRIGRRPYIHYLLKKLNGELPEYFVDSYDLTMEEHLLMQATITQYIDNAVSKTINISKGIPFEVISENLLKYAPRLKGVTIYVDGSREGQVLTPMTEEEIKNCIAESSQVQEEQKCASGKCDL